MVEAIWKTPLIIDNEQAVFIPEGAIPLSVHLQGDTPCIWWKVTVDNTPIMRYIYTCGTGHQHEKIEGDFLGTYLIESLGLVFHVFVKPEV